MRKRRDNLRRGELRREGAWRSMRRRRVGAEGQAVVMFE
jgi:hypothetical protein